MLATAVTLGMLLIFTACGGSTDTGVSNDIADTRIEAQTDISVEDQAENLADTPVEDSAAEQEENKTEPR